MASAPLDKSVLEAMLPWLCSSGNPHARHDLGRLANEAAEKAKSDRLPQPTCVALVSLDRASIRTEGGDTPLEPGMSVTTEIKTGRRTVIRYLLSPLLRLRQEGLRER